MNEPVGSPMPEAPKKSNTGLIIGIAVAVVLCCCCILAVGGWFYGDQIMQTLGF